MGECNKGGWWKSSHGTWLQLWSIVFILLQLASSSSALVLINNFNFTRETYNATIFEKAPGKTYVKSSHKMGIYDSNPWLTVHFKIFDGDKLNVFKAEEYRVGDFYFLRVRTLTSSHGILNRELESRYHLKIKAVGKIDPGISKTATCDLIINILDENDLHPLFDKERYDVTVGEDTPLHSSIITVSASDGDIGINSEIYYSLIQKTDYFAIHPTTGVIFVTKQLNYMVQAKYELEVQAQDRGPKTLRNSDLRKTIVYVTISPANFFSPNILVKQLPFAHMKNIVGTTFAILTITDGDVGKNGLIQSVRIDAGDSKNYFKIIKSAISDEYLLILNKSVIDNENSVLKFVLTVKAIDSGSPSKFSLKAIKINIEDTMNGIPKFMSNSYESSIEESVPVDTSVIHLSASKNNFRRNFDIFYEIDAGNDKNWFSINENTGLIKTHGILDAEMNSEVVLTVLAKEKNSIEWSYTNVTIKILDCNDNPPTFDIKEKDISFDENLTIGSRVYTIHAADPDQGENGVVSYSISNVNSVPFEINHFTGEIKTTKILDYETMKRNYDVYMVASDWGKPFKLESYITLRFHLRNINDNKPQFEKISCSGYLSRDAPIETSIVVITAVDFDNNIIAYNIEEGNEDGCFELAPSTGLLSLNCSLQEYPTEQRSLVITASDGKFTSDSVRVDVTLVNNKRNSQLSNADANVKCSTTNASTELAKLMHMSRLTNEGIGEQIMEIQNKNMKNVHAPVFNPTNAANLEVLESADIGTLLTQIVAYDEDKGYNGMVIYVITAGDPYDQFRLDLHNGSLYVNTELDRENIPKYNLEIMAIDSAPIELRKSANLSISILLKDVNDNVPIFEKEIYETEVSEGIGFNATILQVYAKDKDQDENSKIQYSIVADMSEFYINPDNGILTVKKPLDRELHDVYHIPVLACDQGSPSLSSTATVTLNIMDENDNIPKFIPESYDLKVREDLPVGSVITTVKAVDPDSGPNGKLAYKLSFGSDGMFEIEETTGTVRIVKQLDFQSKQVYNISAFVSDGGIPPLKSACFINVEVMDVNENLEPPVFKNFFEIGYINENMPIGSVVFQVSATDPDSYSNNRHPVTYSIRDGSGLGRFKIDHDGTSNNFTGTITTTQVLDRETAAHYWLSVYAQDRGLVPQHARLDVYIKVIDVNDNIPQMSLPVYYMEVKENSKSDAFVGLVKATDKDENPSEDLTFSITKGNGGKHFQIDANTGVIKTTKWTLDRDEDDSQHLLEISVSDNGIPNLSSTARVLVKVLDENDNAPDFGVHTHRVRILRPKPGSKKNPVLRVFAIDKDEGYNSQLSYKIQGKRISKFYVEKSSGQIYVDDIETGSHSFRVRVYDRGEPRLKDSCKVTVEVMERPKTSANQPEFYLDTFKFQIEENAELGSLVGLMEATDKDSDKLWYNIIDGDEDKQFDMGSEFGNILVAKKLDWETKNYYNITVSVTDGIHVTLTTVYINVIDINDNSPMFLSPSYQTTIPENTEVGMSILKVSAMDRDESNRLFYTITAAENSISIKKFDMDSRTGVVTVREELDREVISTHELTVMVRDQGIPSNRNFTRVIIHVSDHNDHPPKFLSNLIEGRVFESAAIGTSVVEAIALDSDKGENAEISYSIQSGNIGDMFDMDETLGLISVKRELDKNERSEYNLIIMATDHGKPPQSSTATVKIYVTISNNAPPKFTGSEYTAEIHEDIKVGTNVAVLEAKSQSSVYYEIIHGNEDNKFAINPNSGVIYTRNSVDYEQAKTYKLKVSAANIVGYSAVTTVKIHVLDINDNTPVFGQSVYVGSITEAAPVGSVVIATDGKPLVIHASDKDENDNGRLKFEMIGEDALKYFIIDGSTGAIRTSGLLDHETVEKVEFSVQVSDQGNPTLKPSQPAKVVIHIEDVNDHAPVFMPKEFNAVLLLPTANGVRVAKVSATDPDTRSTENVKYRILPENDGFSNFAIDSSTGLITVLKSEEIKSRYSLRVEASDGKFKTTTNVNITLETSENSGFVFSKSDHHVSIRENEEISINLMVIQVVSFGNDPLIFDLMNGNDNFIIGQTSGVLQTKRKKFDREHCNHYDLVVKVQDFRDPPHVAHVVVNVDIEDQNDNSPVFLNQPYDTVVSVNTELGAVVRQLTTVDRDIGDNGRIKFTLVQGYKDKFAVDKDRGYITLQQLLDIEDVGKVILTVGASDHGTPSRNTLVNVTVSIISSEHPVFDKQFYTATIKEDVSLFTPIISVKASSPNGHKLIYSITEGDPYKEFSVDFNIGVVSVVSPLDYESSQGYDLTLSAKDVKTGSVAETNLRINVIDVNDNKPVFSKFKYTSLLSESVPVGTSVAIVTASDADVGSNGLVYYSLVPAQVDSEDVKYFEINSETGLVTTVKILDYEKQSEFNVIAIATDGGQNKHFTTAPIHIILQDLNDNRPYFEQQSYDCIIFDQSSSSYVVKVMASDPDSCSEGNLQYSIVAGNMDQVFHMHQQTGLITLSNRRVGALLHAYILNVSVTDGVFTAFTQVSVSVKGSNDHTPMFTKSLYRATILENLGKGMIVTMVTAFDEDPGMNGMLTYSIPSNEMKQYFSIDADTGEIFSECNFDREDHEFYRVPVAVTDNAGRMGFSLIEVTIRDLNDNPPRFLMNDYKFVVSSSAPVNSSFAKIEAIDKDKGAGGRVRYELAKAEKLFYIHPYTGELKVAKELVPFANQVYQFFVRAIDEGDPSLDTPVTVEIYIMGKDDKPPRFQASKKIIYTISEDETSFSRLIIAESRLPVKYYIMHGNMPETNYPPSFEMSQSGKLRLIGKLDYKAVPKYFLTIQAKTVSTPPLYDYVEVFIIVIDVNNKDPIFESDEYHTTVIENSKPGDKVIQVRAYDEDTYSEITYSFGDNVGNVARVFNLDPTTGWISLINPLDRESVDYYNLTVVAKDIHANNEQTSQTAVIVKVTDQNDNPPIFNRPSYNAAVNEGAALGTILLELNTSDADIGMNTQVEYIIVDGDPLGKFHIRTTGEVIVIKPLDREMDSKYKLMVVATDGGMSTMTKVSVTILDDNDNNPVCEEPMHELILSEDTTVGKIIARVKATDSDDASTINAEISYVIRDGNEKQKFNLDKSTGILTVKSELDREEIDNYHLSINAIDGGGRSCDIDVYIELSDVNDNSPRFIGIPDNFQVMESTERDTLLMRVRAIDDDLGINRQIGYNFRDDADHVFTLDSETGVITLVKSLDREMKDVYKLMLEAYDKGNPSLTGEVQLKITVQDENDNPPEFVHSSYVVSISEDAKINSDVIPVTATSRDIGKNAEMTYYISAGNVDGHFSIDPNSGMIRVIQSLDHETMSEYILTIIAHDRSAAPLSSSTYVTVNVTDVNDNCPQFVQDHYKLSLREDVLVNEVILHLTASDEDLNSVIIYSITKGNKMEKFDVNPRDGKLTIKAPLDREMINNFELTIKASDGQLSSKTKVVIDVLDVNDCPPKFSEANYSAVIQEDRHVGHHILAFSVTDDDLPPANGQHFAFDIVSGNADGEFLVTSEGVLTTAGKFNRHVQNMYNLVVRAYDLGMPSLHSDVPVRIEIIEEGNNPPKVANTEISVMSFKDSFPGGIIGKVDAVDEDIFDELTYEIISSNKNLFDVDKYDGRIMALTNIDPGKYSLNISVSDGRFESFGIVNVDIVGISDEMVKNSVTIQFHSLSTEDFYNKHLKDLKRVLKREIKVRSKDIEIINVQPSMFSPSSFGRRRKRREISTDLDVLFAIKRNQNSFIRGKPLGKKIGIAIPAIEQALDVKVIRVFNDICNRSSCKEGTCEGYIEFDPDNLTPVKMGAKSTVTSRHQYLYRCVCPDGSTADSCDLIPTVCPDNACTTDKECKANPDQGGYICVCPAGKSGQFCDEDEDYCFDSSCRRGDKPMTFSGKSYARWTLQDSFTIESRLSLSLKIKTRKQVATIMYAKGKVDYSILEIFNGILQYRFNCGSGEGTVVIPLLVSDGKWHTILVERHGNIAELILDDKYSSMAKSPGTNDVLDLRTNHVYFGAEVEIYNGFDDIRHGFEGCMENIRLYNVRLPFDGSNAVAMDLEFKSLQFHCKDSYQGPLGTNICSTFPCDNNGNCQATENSYMCTCSDRFYGQRCEIDSDPCANSPCKNNGQCLKKQDIPNDFECKCMSPFRGKFCEYGKFCTEEKCKNNGTCIEGPYSMVCNCLAGFEGKNCEKIVSACQSGPCMNGATCHNTDNTYICNCTEKSAGRNCEELIAPNMVSSPAGITQEELYIIIGVAGGLIFLAFLFVAIQCYRRQRNSRYSNITLGIPTDETDVMLRSLKEDTCTKNGIKKSNMDITHPPPSPRPPPVPDRPASYTPSNHDSLNTLNNFDNVRNYGADELENIQNIPYYAEYLQTFAPLPRMVASQAPSLAPLPSSNTPSDTDSIHKTPWEMENMLEHHEDKNHHEKFYVKNIPGPQVGPPDNVSFSSLPVSESEDEPAASKSGRRKKRKDYHWDASDWAPQPSLPNISEVPNRECPDSPSSSPHSNESNEHADCRLHSFSNDMGMYTDPEMLESEYVGDSEFADNECDTDHYLNPPNYQEIFSQYINNDDSEPQGSYRLPQHNLRTHPNEYLPTYHLNDESRDDYSDNENFPDPPEEFRGGENCVSQLSRYDLDDNDEVVHYGFPAQQPLLGFQGNITDSEYNVRSSMIDSMGGYTSTNASCSDISGLCEIEDSEVNLSEEDSGDENNENTPLNLQRLHTQV